MFEEAATMGPVDPEEAERLLENLRRAVPLPSDYLRKAG
jgi:hypothetical protein